MANQNATVDFTDFYAQVIDKSDESGTKTKIIHGNGKTGGTSTLTLSGVSSTPSTVHASGVEVYSDSSALGDAKIEMELWDPTDEMLADLTEVQLDKDGWITKNTTLNGNHLKIIFQDTDISGNPIFYGLTNVVFQYPDLSLADKDPKKNNEPKMIKISGQFNVDSNGNAYLKAPAGTTLDAAETKIFGSSTATPTAPQN